MPAGGFSRIIRGFRLVALLCVAALSVCAAAPVGPARKPKLVVLVVVDQFREDYLTRFRSEYKGGFDRLLKNGAVFTNAYLDHFPSVTALVHATLLSGAAPSLTGIVGDDWYDRESGRLVGAAFDPSVKILGGNGAGASPRNLLTGTVGDELKMAGKGASRVIGISLKDYSATMLAGRMADSAYWFDRSNGNFVSSTFYFPELPPWVKEFNTQRSVDRWAGAGWTAATGKLLETLPAKPGAEYYLSVAASPFGDELLLSFAERAIEAEQLGSRDGVDLLSISLSSTDWVGHAFGPDSPEIHDTNLRTDRGLGQFFQYLDKRFGAGSVLVVLTADHGVAPLPETQAKRGMSGGRMANAELQKAADTALQARFGAGKWVLYSAYGTFWLNSELIRQRNLKEADVEECVAGALAGVPHVYRVYTRTQLLHGEFGQDPVSRRVANSFFPSRSGDVIATLEPYWIYGATGTTHGSAYNYDTHVPLIFMGPGIKPGLFDEGVSTDDIAPTLATLLEIETPSGSVGRALREMFAPR
jgi:predicted AlkP superfamily pyrophosphatase or phosphodiesterase